MKPRAIRIWAAFILVFGTLFTFLVSRANAEPSVPDILSQAGAAALMELEGGSFLAEKNADTPLPMASTTKIMTALVVLECCGLDELVSVPDEAVGVEGSSINLRYGEELTVRDLLYGLMLASGNDAAAALAVHAGGSVERFAGMMNSRAARMGLAGTHFITPNGLHAAGHFTTARELCLVAAEALKNPEFRRIVSARYYTAESGSSPRTFRNKNSLLFDYEGALGVKTGYTSAAGRCLVFAAERDGMRLLGVVLNCRPMFETARALMDLAFSRYSASTVAGPDTPAAEVFVENGEETVLELFPESSIMAVTESGSLSSFRLEAEVPASVRAPVERGEVLGMLRVYKGEVLYASVPLRAGRSVGARSFSYWFGAMCSLFVKL